MSSLPDLSLLQNVERMIAFFMALLVSISLTPAAARSSDDMAGLHAQQRVLPLDPLTTEEIETAERIANADARVKQALGGGRQRLIHVQFLALKPPDYSSSRVEPEQIKLGRHAEVLFYRYDTDQGVSVVVNLEQRSVQEVNRVEGRSVPLALEEVTEAFTLALRNERVRSLLGPQAGQFRVARLTEREQPENRVEGLRIVAVSPKDPCYRRRCVNLLFRQGNSYIAGTAVTVDLSSQTVRVERTLR